jgi:hypothetical protein
MLMTPALIADPVGATDTLGRWLLRAPEQSRILHAVLGNPVGSACGRANKANI